MKARGLAAETSWRFYGAIHGFDPSTWQELGYLSAADPLPSNSVQAQFWKQCQHGTWYFLPWHRGYLLAFEANIRAEVIKLGGPADWALPYWNYFKANESGLPPAFASPDWPDGKGNNPLYVPQRYGPKNNGQVSVPIKKVNLKAMLDPEFTGVASGGSPGFGGVDTGFMHSGAVHGGLESQPHDMVHVYVGGSDPSNPQLPGLMSDPDTAGLDPIFWLHHGNIDRLWEVWRQNPATHTDPTDAHWLNGPTSLGERAFAMPMPDGTSWTYTPSDMADLAKLNYTYDDLSPAVPAPKHGARLLALGFASTAADQQEGVAAVKPAKKVEMFGATQAPIHLLNTEVHASVHLDKGAHQKVSASLTPSAMSAGPDRVFLNLENVRSNSDGGVFDVYVGVAEDAKSADHPELLGGSFALFGARKASLVDEEHGGQGLTYVIEITDIVDQLHLGKKFDADELSVRIVPAREVSETAKVSIGRISVYRQGQ